MTDVPLHAIEPIRNESTGLDRVRVPGGWLYRSWLLYQGAAVHTCFVPDPPSDAAARAADVLALR